MPDAVRLRFEKSFFSPLLPASLARPEGRILADLLSDPHAPVRAYAGREAIDAAAVVSHEAGGGRRILEMWRWGMLDCWLHSLEDPGLPERLMEQSASNT